ncbi:trypsin-like serine protease [Rhodococcus sp. UNC363MFTsu5.1]|uniref:trypsin-like serine protease n=1 Tax=Rhodococcus sp. UNC363MFTsu5.1 TaxID=1449069 RepID=UPI00048768FE|nr:trypsin-like serine protease [Rhodococcus sp. UNC363MFTsu5.1]
MKRSTRYLSGLLTAAALTASLGAGTAQAEPVQVPSSTASTVAVAQSGKVVAAGMRLAFDNNLEHPDMCTLGAVGTDSQGRKVGITAGHCNPWEPIRTIKGPLPRVRTLANTHPVWDWRDMAAGPIGWIRWVSADQSECPAGSGLCLNPLIAGIDYMVIEFADTVALSSQVMTVPKYGPDANGVPFNPDFTGPAPYVPGPIQVPSEPWFKMNAISADSAGNPTVAGAGTTICNAGSTTVQGYAQAGDPKTVQCGPVIYNQAGRNYSWAGMKQGDSGGPMFVKGKPNEWAGIASWIVDGFPTQYQVYTSAKKILDDMNGQTGDFPGKGFQITNN